MVGQQPGLKASVVLTCSAYAAGGMLLLLLRWWGLWRQEEGVWEGGAAEKTFNMLHKERAFPNDRTDTPSKLLLFLLHPGEQDGPD